MSLIVTPSKITGPYARYTPMRISIDHYTWSVFNKFADVDSIYLTRNAQLAAPAKLVLFLADKETKPSGYSPRHNEWWVTIHTSKKTASILLEKNDLYSAIQQTLKYHATQWLIGYVTAMTTFSGTTITAAIQQWQQFIGIDDDVRDSFTLIQTYQRYKPVT